MTAEFDAWLANARREDEERRAVLAANPNGGNLYKAHVLMIHSGQFWRCAHGRTGFEEGCGYLGLAWAGCEDCRRDNPTAAALYEFGGFEDGAGI